MPAPCGHRPAAAEPRQGAGRPRWIRVRAAGRATLSRSRANSGVGLAAGVVELRHSETLSSETNLRGEHGTARPQNTIRILWPCDTFSVWT
jgi:hypothetical protein